MLTLVREESASEQDFVGDACRQLLADMETSYPPGPLMDRCDGPVPPILANLATHLDQHQPVVCHATPWRPDDWRTGLTANSRRMLAPATIEALVNATVAVQATNPTEISRRDLFDRSTGDGLEF